LSRGRQRLAGGLEFLKDRRDGEGGWRRFPFHYTLLALSEIEGKRAASEMQYAAPLLERVVRRRGGRDRFAIRRRAIAERVLARL